ncbi:MAG: hypothetical protein WC879_03605 [Melioribacteraceae bacterium]
MELFGLFWIVCWIATIIISSKKGEGCLAVITGFFFGPLALIFAIVGTGNKIKCPFCQELIEKKALICPHCRSDLLKDNPQTYEELKKQIKKEQL